MGWDGGPVTLRLGNGSGSVRTVESGGTRHYGRLPPSLRLSRYRPAPGREGTFRRLSPTASAVGSSAACDGVLRFRGVWLPLGGVGGFSLDVFPIEGLIGGPSSGGPGGRGMRGRAREGKGGGHGQFEKGDRHPPPLRLAHRPAGRGPGPRHRLRPLRCPRNSAWSLQAPASGRADSPAATFAGSSKSGVVASGSGFRTSGLFLARFIVPVSGPARVERVMGRNDPQGRGENEPSWPCCARRADTGAHGSSPRSAGGWSEDVLDLDGRSPDQDSDPAFASGDSVDQPLPAGKDTEKTARFCGAVRHRGTRDGR